MWYVWMQISKIHLGYDTWGMDIYILEISSFYLSNSWWNDNHLSITWATMQKVPLDKHHRSSFPKESTFRVFKPLQFVHTNVCGPIFPNSFRENKYFLTFTDDFSIKSWVYFLKNKSEVFKIFKKFKTSLIEEGNSHQRNL